MALDPFFLKVTSQALVLSQGRNTMMNQNINTFEIALIFSIYTFEACGSNSPTYSNGFEKACEVIQGLDNKELCLRATVITEGHMCTQ